MDRTSSLALRAASCVALPLCLCLCLVAAASERGTWQVRESENFRIFAPRGFELDAGANAACEKIRSQLMAFWLGEQTPTAWQPKCDIVLHATRASYLAAVGRAGAATIGSSLTDDRDGKITLRRIDVRATVKDWCESVCPHEITHIILADRFLGKPAARWLEEGMAVLADTNAKRRRHLADFSESLSANRHFRLIDFVALEDYPEETQMDVYYGQAASLVSFLVSRDSPRRLFEFVDLVDRVGYLAALRQVYGFRSFAECELAWHAAMLTGAPQVTALDLAEAPLRTASR